MIYPFPPRTLLSYIFSRKSEIHLKFPGHSRIFWGKIQNMTPPSNDASSSYPPPLSYVEQKAKEILATRDVTRITKLVTKLCYGKETEETSEHLYESFTKHFPNLLAVKLLQVYLFNATRPSRSTIRSHSLSLLDSLLIDLEDSRTGLRIEALKDIKEHLDSFLLLRQTSDHDFKLIARIISRVSVDLFINERPWEELCFFIISLDDKRTLLLFSELPSLLDEAFLLPLMEYNLDSKITRGLLDQDRDDEERWCLALEAGFNLMLQLINCQRKDLVWDLVYAIVSSVWEMVNVRNREIVARKGLMKLARKVRREASRFHKPEYEVVSRLALMLKRINGLGEVTETAAKTIHDVLERYYMEGKGLDLSFILSQTGIKMS